MSPQQLALTAPALWVEKEPSLPLITHGHRIALEHLGRAFTEARPADLMV